MSFKDKTRINEQIRAPEIRVVTEDGDMLGVMTPEEAMKRATEEGKDLIEISPNATPPVCKILDYGKYKYQLQKRANEARKKQKTIDVKEIKLRPNIDTHDFDVKLRNIERFINDGNKVKIVMRFRGREMAHKQLGEDVFRRITEHMEDKIKVDQAAKFMGRQMIMVIAPA